MRYVVRSGDTLGILAVKYGTTVAAIMAANGISNPNHIYPGLVLHIPMHRPPIYHFHHHYHHYPTQYPYHH